MATKKKAASKKPAGIAKRVATVQRQMEKVVAAQAALQEAIQKLVDEVGGGSMQTMGGGGGYNPRLLSVVPVDMDKLLRSFKK